MPRILPINLAISEIAGRIGRHPSIDNIIDIDASIGESLALDMERGHVMLLLADGRAVEVLDHVAFKLSAIRAPQTSDSEVVQ